MRAAAVLLALLLLPATAWAQEEPGLLGGFDEETPGDDGTPSATEDLWDIGDTPSPDGGADNGTDLTPSRLYFKGYTKLSLVYNYAHHAPAPGATDWRGLSRARMKGYLELGYDLTEAWKVFLSGYAFYDAAYGLNGRDRYTDTVLRAYEREAELTEAYLQGRLSRSADVTVGRQIVVWGRSDSVRVTDVLNPLDNRTPGITDIENLRLPVAMTKLDLYHGAWELNLIALHENRVDKLPAQGSDFLPSTMALPSVTEPDGQQYAARVRGIFSRWDVSFYYARVYEHTPHIKLAPSPRRAYALVDMTGLSANLPMGNWMLKGEAAFFSGFRFTNVANDKRRTDLMAGLEYSGFTDQMIAVEYVQRTLHDFAAAMKNYPDYARERETQTVLRYTGDFMRDRLHLLFLASAFGSGGGYGRFSAEYEVTDTFSLTGGAVDYRSGDQYILRSVGDNDRLLAEARYSF